MLPLLWAASARVTTVSLDLSALPALASLFLQNPLFALTITVGLEPPNRLVFGNALRQKRVSLACHTNLLVFRLV